MSMKRDIITNSINSAGKFPLRSFVFANRWIELVSN